MSTIMAFTCPSLFYKYSMQGEEEMHPKTRKQRENERREEEEEEKKNSQKFFL